MAVSSTSVRGFKLYRDLRGAIEAGVTMDFIIDNSVTLTLGDAVRLDTAGYIKTAAATGCILGVVVGLVDQNDINVFETGRVPALSVAGATLTGQDTIAVSSTNTTDGTRNLKAKVMLDPAGYLVWKNQASATGLLQAYVGGFFNLLTAKQVDETSYSATSGQLQLLQIDPDGEGTDRGLFRIVQNQLATNAPSYGSTAIVAA